MHEVDRKHTNGYTCLSIDVYFKHLGQEFRNVVSSDEVEHQTFQKREVYYAVEKKLEGNNIDVGPV